MSAPVAVPGQIVLSGPERSGSERRWHVRLPDGRAAVLAQLLPELARDEALRRRYVRDAERLAALEVQGVARVLAVGPPPDPRDPTAEPPWRLREDPAGESLEAWLRARAPVPVDEAIDLAVRLCELLERVHARGAVLRDLQPRQIVHGDDGVPVLTDIGLARVDILSTRTASSLILEGSPYAAPEHLRATRLDARADLYTVGVILWRALTGTLPFGDGPALLRERKPLPPLATVRPGAPMGLDGLVGRLLSEKPEERPDSASEVIAALRGEPAAPRSLALVVCQACGARLRAGLRLCLACGKQAVRFRRAADARADGWDLELTKVKEDAAYLEALRDILGTVAPAPLPPLNFMTEDHRMYSKDERKALTKLPARLFEGLDEETATELHKRMKARGLVVDKSSRRARRRILAGGLGAVGAGAAVVVGGIAAAVAWPIAVGLITATLGGSLAFLGGRRPRRHALLQLREAPAALSASDPLVARLGALLGEQVQPDVREQVVELAVLVQRLADHRAEQLGAPGTPATATELEAVIKPVEPLVGLLERSIQALVALDRELGGLDEAMMVRALASSEARREPPSRRASILAGLDRLRTLEDERAAQMARLLEVSTLLRRSITTGLRVGAPDAAGRAELQMALAALEE